MKILQGDALVQLRTIPACCIDAIVTDPPYELGFMGKVWDKSGVANSVELWREALRVLKPGGHLLAFGGSRTYHRMTCAIEDAGFEIRDQIMWLYGSGFPKSHNLDGDWNGWGTALKPAHEPICVARKPIEGTVVLNVLRWGTGALNINACRVHAEDAKDYAYTVTRLKPGATLNKTGGNWRPEDGGVEYQGHTQDGRWPANLIHDGGDEVLEAFPNAPGQCADVKYDTNERKTQSVYGAMKRGHEPSAERTYEENGSTNFAMKPGARRLDQGSAVRFFYCAKTSKAERGEGNTHPTVKPLALMRYLCRLVTPPRGIVLDPFMGSGSTGVAAIKEGFEFIGIELNPDYIAMANNRILKELLS